MKRFTFRTISVMVVFLIGFHQVGWGQIIITDNFNYADNAYLTANGWFAHSGAGTNPIAVGASNGLSYAGYSGVTGVTGAIEGNAAKVVNTGEDDSRLFTAIPSGTIYFSSLVKVTSGTLGYFMSLFVTTSILPARVWVKPSATPGKINFGISNSSTAVYAATPTDFDPLTTYLFIVKYDVSSTGSVSLWVKSSGVPSSEASAGTPEVSTSGSGATGILAFALRQYSSSQSMEVDGLRIGMTWADILNPALPTVATPTFSPAPGVYETTQNVTLSCATEGASIYYTTDGSDPTDLSTIFNPLSPIIVSGTTQIKAIAYKTGMNTSSIAVGWYRFPVSVSNIANLRAGLTDGTVYKLTAEAVVTYARASGAVGRNQKFVQDATGAILIDDPSTVITTPYIIGDGVTNLMGTLTLYNSLVEFIPVSDPGAPSSTGHVTVPEVKTFATLTSSDQSKLVSIAMVTFGTPSGLYVAGTNYAVTDPTGSSTFRTGFAESDYIGTTIPAAAQNMVALVGQFGTAMQITPRNLADMTPASAPLLTISPTSLSGFSYLVGSGPSASQSFTLSGSNLTPTSGDITVTGYSYYEVSSNNADFGTTATYSYTDGALSAIPVYVRLKAGLSAGPYLESVDISGGGATTRNLACSGSVDQVPVSYTWQGADLGLWTTSTNWNPTRTTPATNDMLLFSDGTAKTVTGVPTEIIGQLILSNNTTVTMESSAAVTLTIRGGAGIDLDVPAGSALNLHALNATNAITLSLATGATGSISGNMTFSGTTSSIAHHMIAVNASAITFNSGATFTAGTNFSGNAFGSTSTVPVPASFSVVFAGGSTYVHQSGSNPFSLSAPESAVVFNTGSLYKVTGPGITPSFAGRTYGNFEVNSAGNTYTPSGGNSVVMDNLTITNGTLNFNMTGTPGHSIKGNIVVATGGVLNFNPSSAGTVAMNGTGAQTITVDGTLSTAAFSTIKIDNSAGVTLNSPVTLGGNLELASGLLTLGSNNLTLGAGSAVTGTPSASAMVVAIGSGQLRKDFSAAGSFIFPVGDNSGTADYSPVTLNFTEGSFASAHAGVNLVNEKHPDVPGTGSYLTRYWNITQGGISAFKCTATFQYVPLDVNGTEAQIYCTRVVPAPFTAYDPANTEFHYLRAVDLTTFSTFTGAQAPPIVLTKPATGVDVNVATLNATVIANYQSTDVSFEYGTTDSYGTTVPATGSPVIGGDSTNLTADLTGLAQGTTYHFRAVGTNASGTSYGVDRFFTTTCVFPGPAGAISGPATVCGNNTGYEYSVDPIENATAYVWLGPEGSAIINNGTSATISFGSFSGDVYVFGTNECFDEGEPSAVAVEVTVPVAVSVSVEASANNIPSGTEVTFTATPSGGGTTPSYQWKVNNLPVSGATNVTYTYYPVNDDVVVCVLTSSESCTTGNPATSDPITMIVTGLPENITVTGTVPASPPDVCYAALNTITVAGTAAFEVLPFAHVTMIAGERIFYLPGTKVDYEGYMRGHIVPGGQACPPAKATEIQAGREENLLQTGSASFKVYPNPTNGVFTIEQRGDGVSEHVRVEVLGTLGGKILSTELQNIRKEEISIKGNPPGIYFVRMTTGENVQTVKIILTN